VAYHNRAMVYYLKGEYTKAQEDIAKAKVLGYPVDSGFLADLTATQKKK
jgi:hypothetical protein